MEFRGPGCGFQAELDAGNEYNWTPLHWAAKKGHATVVTNLRQANAAVDAANVNGWTPLHWAAWYGHAAVAELLLQANASPTAVNNSGKTPADFAKQCGHDELAQPLRERSSTVSRRSTVTRGTAMPRLLSCCCRPTPAPRL